MTPILQDQIIETQEELRKRNNGTVPNGQTLGVPPTTTTVQPQATFVQPQVGQPQNVQQSVTTQQQPLNSGTSKANNQTAVQSHPQVAVPQAETVRGTSNVQQDTPDVIANAFRARRERIGQQNNGGTAPDIPIGNMQAPQDLHLEDPRIAQRNVFGVLPGETATVTKQMGSPLNKDQMAAIKDGVDTSWKAYKAKLASDTRDKRDNRRLKFLAITDALRHMGQLYYTGEGATPQKFTSPVTDEYARQEKERAKEQAEALAAEQRAYERAKDARDFNYKLGKDATELEKWKGEFGLKANDDKRKADKNARENAMFPSEKELKDAQAALARAKAAYEKESNPLKLQKLGKEINLLLAKSGTEKAKQGNLRSSTNLNYTKAGKIAQEVSEKETVVPNWYQDPKTGKMKYNDDRHWVISHNGKQKVVSSLADWAKKNGWLKTGSNGQTTINAPVGMSADMRDLLIGIASNTRDASKLDEVFEKIMENSHDPQVQRIMRQHGKLVDSKTGKQIKEIDIVK